MSRKTIIEQHPLIDGLGNRVDFLIDDWGEINDFNYDYLKAHRHNFYEILVFEKGNANHDIDFSTFVAKSGNVHFVAPDNVHLLLREKNSQGFSIQFTNGHFTSELTDKLPFNSIQPTLKLSKSEFKKVMYLISQIRAELSNLQHLSDTLIRSYFKAVLLLLARKTSLNISSTQIKSQSFHIDNFKKLVNDNYRHHYTVKHYALLLHISAKHLIETCKEHTGKTPLKIIQESIISEAKQQLFHTDNSIKEIAYSLGFDDPSNFSKYFKNASGFSPLAYRQDLGK